MSWLFLTIISAFFRAVYGLMTKVLSNKTKTSAYTQATLLPLYATIIVVLMSPFFGGINFPVDKNSFILILLIALSQGLGNVMYFTAMKSLTSGTAQISFSSILVFNTILSVGFLNLHLSFLNVVGIILLMLAVLSVVSGKIELNKKGVILMTFSAFLFSIFQLSSSKLSTQVSAATYLLISYLGSVLVLIAIKGRIIIKDIINSDDKKNLILIPFLTTIPSLGNFIFAYFAYRTAPQPAKVAMLLTSQVVIAVILSYFFLNEKKNLFRKVFAAILVVISAILIKI
jgi:drug/metabolite transporter (DMT)-like permease